MLKDRLIIKDDKLILSCVECGEPIEDWESDRKQFCSNCIKKHQRKKNKKYYEKTNYWSSPQYRKYRQKKRAIKKLNGKNAINYSQHLYHGENGKSGKPNFDREKEIVKRIYNYTFKFGSSIINNGFFSYPKVICDESKPVRTYQLISNDIIDIIECPLCKNESFIRDMPPHSFDYNSEGMVYIHCSNCGYVVN